MPFDRELGEVFQASNDGLLEGIRKCAPGIVTAVNGAFVDVQLATNSPLFDEYGNATFEPAPFFGGVPLATWAGGGFSATFPVAVGDGVLVVFSDLSADTWRSSTGAGTVNPGFLGRHTSDSPFAIPCVRPDANAIAPTAGKIVIGKTGGNSISISATDIELGGTSDAVALASKVDAFIHAVMGWIPVANDGGAALKAALSSAGFTITYSSKSTVVKSA